MGIHVALKHRTHYRYEKPVVLGPQVVQLRPAPHCRVPILGYSLEVTPVNHSVYWQVDPHSNRIARLLFPEKTNELAIEVNLVADLSPINPFDFLLDPAVEKYPFRYTPALSCDLVPFLVPEQPGPLLRHFLHGLSGQTSGTVEFLLSVNRKLQEEIAYETRHAPGVQSGEETLARRFGSCRDSAWLLVEILRNLGIAARFVSGYLIQLSTDGAPRPDSADLHSWTEAYLPGGGWIGLDPTSGLLTAECHIPLMCAATSAQAAPIVGTAEMLSIDFRHSVTVHRLEQPGSARAPFSEPEWQRVRQLAHTVDRELAANDVRLTMGGEPTFVAIDEPESPQWNTEALGKEKRTRGLALMEAISRRVAPGALLHYGQGKWYPSEPLPRWALSCYWRTDGTPIWEELKLIAREDHQYDLTVSDASHFIHALARRLQVSGDNVLPASNPDSSPDEPVGYILPIRRRQADGTLFWSSQLWFPGPESVVLLEGESPIGYRIPAEAVPWVSPDELNREMDAPPFADRAKLPAQPVRHMELFAVEPDPDPLPAILVRTNAPSEQIRPSLCIEAREGRMHVFMPYVRELADYIDLISAVEDTCRSLEMPVWIEGYAPASDPRLHAFSVTPDPGVLEINLPPAASWDELEKINAILDEEARKNRLTAEKFDYDGAHRATGGGSHIVIGGASVTESPVLRHPSLLRSMLTFWQNHPSLSFLFSGTYVGPTSQCPRIDEARMDTLDELEIAFQQLPSSDCPPWIVDALFRNLLADVSGNTHRSEFCIDKLFPPPGQGSQLGLVELRAFEMPPHVRMNLLQLLLVRALVCCFWKTPFEDALVRWGPALHYEFLLPHYAKKDLTAVLAHLRQSGFDFDEAWFAAHLEFRFPKIGSVSADGIELELRRALEPWNVLGEETVSGRTVRNVDSSLERLQVRLSGATPESRYVVTCNGRRVPLEPTDEAGVSIAGVRYRARKLSALLHPTIPVHAPLIFEMIDSWMNRSIAQCTYHVESPRSERYPARPADAAEAEQRRSERFQVNPQARNATPPPPEELNRTFPGTLDLRTPQRPPRQS